MRLAHLFGVALVGVSVGGDVARNRRAHPPVRATPVTGGPRHPPAPTAPGEIVIGGSTLAELASLDGEFRTQSLGDFQLKGLVQKVPVYRVLWDAE